MKSQSEPQRNRPVTMRDVAELANVSQSTVSRVLSQTDARIPISEATRQRVIDAVQELGYMPNLHARSLRGKPSHMVAMMIADIDNPFYHRIVRAVQDVAHSHGYDVMVANSDHKRTNEEMFCEALIRRPVDGVILVPYHLTAPELGRMMDLTSACVAVLSSYIHHPMIDVVEANGEEVLYDTVKWIIEEKEHTRVAFIGVTEEFFVGRRRLQAYRNALAAMGVEVPPTYVEIGDWSVTCGQIAMHRLMALPVPPTAVIAINDHTAIGAMLAARELGLRIPEDVALVGFDDIPAASWLQPRLTTIAQYPEAMGKQLANALFDRMLGHETGPGRHIVIPCRLIEREST